MPGKNPHRPEGKKGADEWDRRASDRLDAQRQLRDSPTDDFGKKPSEGAETAPRPTRIPAEEQIGGSRPGVESRMRREIEEEGGE